MCGVMSVFSSLRYCLGDPAELGTIGVALGFLPFGLFFDFMDGKVARWRKKSSLMGQELDSLADLVRHYSSRRRMVDGAGYFPRNLYSHRREPVRVRD